MTAPSWLLAAAAALMLVIAASCAARLAIWRRYGRATEADADALHVLMGVAMAGMLEPRLTLLPGVAWLTMFAAAAAWFGWQAVRTRSRRQPSAWRCGHPAPHAIECAAMVYMLVPAMPAGHPPAMAMSGMSGSAAGSNPAIALVLALFMLGYILWTTDRLAGLSRASAAAGHPGNGPSKMPTAPRPAFSGRPIPRAPAPRPARGAADSPLAPRFAASYKIAMSIAMGCMLVMML